LEHEWIRDAHCYKDLFWMSYNTWVNRQTIMVNAKNISENPVENANREP
jgi:Fe-S cluster biosynthesis and repair protein YggX